MTHNIYYQQLNTHTKQKQKTSDKLANLHIFPFGHTNGKLHRYIIQIK